MTSFLQDVILDLQKKEVDFSKLTFVLPSKRAGIFLSSLLAKHLKKTLFAPKILSIEEFIEDISDLNYASNTELIFEVYEVYLTITPEEQADSFDVFSKWAPLLIQDFNEIDRYLIPTDNVFDYLTAIKELNHWSLAQDQTQSVKNYVSFWHRLKLYYHGFRQQLISKKKGYQGLVYREAVDNLEHYIASCENTSHIFVGFNALNKAEESIIQELLQQGLASIYWDLDETFFDNTIHDAGHFIRRHAKSWSYYKSHSLNWLTNHYSSNKNIHSIGAPKNVGQVKYIGELLSTLKQTAGDLQQTAVVLGDESLLLPLLNSIPKGIQDINITMGLPLKSVPLASIFESLFKLHKNNSESYYFKDISFILNHQYVQPLFQDGTTNFANIILDHIQNNNVVYLSLDKLIDLAQAKQDVIEVIFESWQQNPDIAIQNCSELIFLIKNHLSIDKDNNILSLEYLFRFNEIFNQLSTLNRTYHHLKSLQSLSSLYKELLKSETLDFKGEPLQGLQIMGMLETRVLDFETVIISSVNEGILPAGKSNNSFIPFDVKVENGLPTYKEKDAVYTYHFYRLLQRAKNIYIIYNTEPDVLNGGEKSRFITQLDIERLHPVRNMIVSPKVPSLVQKLKTVPKTDAVMEQIRKVALNGFSPSSLTNYIRNPIDFYYDKILGIKSYDEVEETVAANTLGTVIHETLEAFYKPLINVVLTKPHIVKMKDSIDVTVAHHFKKHFKEGNLTTGKNLIVFEIAKRYIHNFLKKELEAIESGQQIKIIDVERKMKVPVAIPELSFPAYLNGTVDRIDECDGVLRIIDYKTGKVDKGKVEIVNWEDVLTDYDKYSKSFQVLCYAYMLNDCEHFSTPVEAGIISFKNLQAEPFLKFGKKDKTGRGADITTDISRETLEEFSFQLKKLIIEIANPEIDFVEKKIDH